MCVSGVAEFFASTKQCLRMTLDLERTAGYVLLAILHHDDVVALLRGGVGDVVVVAALVSDVDALARSPWSVHGHEQHVVA